MTNANGQQIPAETIQAMGADAAKAVLSLPTMQAAVVIRQVRAQLATQTALGIPAHWHDGFMAALPDLTFCSCGCDSIVMIGGKAAGDLAENRVMKCGELHAIELFVRGHGGGPILAAPRPSTCPGCSGGGELTDDPQVLRCLGCGGIFTDAQLPITFEQAMKFVAINQAMLPNAGVDGSFYFDLDVLDPILKDGKTFNRLHGWADRKTKRVVQWG
jgi:hypothetical protein